MKICPMCKKEKIDSEFGFRSKNSKYLKSKCKTCNSEYVKKYYKNPDNYNKIRETQKRYKNKDIVKYIFNKAKYSANKRGISFFLEYKDIKIPEYCPIFNIKLNNGEKLNAISIDRIDSCQGYTADNIQVLSWKANHIKSDATLEELDKIIRFYEKLSSDEYDI